MSFDVFKTLCNVLHKVEGEKFIFCTCIFDNGMDSSNYSNSSFYNIMGSKHSFFNSECLKKIKIFLGDFVEFF